MAARRGRTVGGSQTFQSRANGFTEGNGARRARGGARYAEGLACSQYCLLRPEADCRQSRRFVRFFTIGLLRFRVHSAPHVRHHGAETSPWRGDSIPDRKLSKHAFIGPPSNDCHSRHSPQKLRLDCLRWEGFAEALPSSLRRSHGLQSSGPTR